MKVYTSDVGVKNGTKVITKLQRSNKKPIRKSCNGTGQKKQQLDIFGLCSHALGLARSWRSWQQSEHMAVRTQALPSHSIPGILPWMEDPGSLHAHLHLAIPCG